MRSDHPRACGANVSPTTPRPAKAGSSPRVRGKPGSCRCSGRHRRIIPARAGQTQWREPEHNAPADHPRACGANSNKGSATVSASGSSPRVRGKRERVGGDGTAMRIIPARAGQTTSRTRTACSTPDHPRACGANHSPVERCSAMSGSSPRVRGKPPLAVSLHGPRRIIPARAGQTVHTVTPPSKIPDHPRACGANADPDRMRRAVAGSSPRVRGKRHIVVVFERDIRIIPARAGQTVANASKAPGQTDHPRACGANLLSR